MLFLILLLGLILRLISINQSFWLDEAVQVWASSSFSVQDLLTKYMPGDFNPPLYHLLLHFWIKLFGTSEIGTRSLSLVLATGSVWLIWKIGRMIDNSKLGATSALLLATSPLHIYYSQENRMYMLACFTVLLSFWRFLTYLKKTNRQNGFFLGFGLFIMGFSHFLTLFTLPIFLIILIKNKKPLWPFLILLLGYLVYSPLFLKQFETGLGLKSEFPVWSQTVGSFSLKSAALLPVKFIIGRISINNKIIYGLLSMVLVGFYWGLAIKSFFSKKRHLLISLLLFMPPALGFLISFWIPVFSYFRFLYVLPFFYLVIAKVEREGLIALLLLINLICSGVYLFNPEFHRENWRGMVDWLYRENKSQAPVLILNQVAKPFEYYDQGKSNLVFVLPFKERASSKIFLVSYGLPIFDPKDKIRSSLEKLGYKIVEGESFRGVGVERWQNEMQQQ